MRGMLKKAVRKALMRFPELYELVNKLRELTSELRIRSRHRASVLKTRKLLKETQELKIELGGGKQHKPGFINVDLFSPFADLQLDLRRKLPFPDESVDFIYAEHVLEHFSYPHPLSDLLKECYRVLKVGGCISVSVPDAGRALRMYSLPLEEFDKTLPHEGAEKPSFWTTPKTNWCKSPIDYINWLVYMDGHHRFMFDEVNLVERLQEVGFSARIRDFDPSLDRDVRQVYSIYALGVKAVFQSNAPYYI